MRQKGPQINPNLDPKNDKKNDKKTMKKTMKNEEVLHHVQCITTCSASPPAVQLIVILILKNDKKR